MSAFPGLVQRVVTVFLAVTTVVGLLYWASGKRELGASNHRELRARIKSETVDRAERASLLLVQDVYAANEGAQKRILAPSSENTKADHEMSGDMVERIYVNLTAINAGLAVGMALFVVSRRKVSAAGGFFALGLSCFALALCWLLVSGQAPGRRFLPEVPVQLYYAGHVFALVCWGSCIAAMDGFFTRFPRRIAPNEIYEADKALPRWTRVPAFEDLDDRSHPFNRWYYGLLADSTGVTRWIPLVALVTASFDLIYADSSWWITLSPLLNIGLIVGLGYVVWANWFRLNAARHSCTIEERRQTDWFYVGLSLACAVLLIAALPSYLEWGIRYIMGIALPATGFVLLLSFGLSVFLRGAFDSGLLIRKATWIALIALCMSLLLAVIQHVVTANLLSHSTINMQHGFSTVLAGGIAVFSLGIFRVKMERGIDGFLNRFMPATVIADGRRRDATVAFSDLGGYTALSAKDETQALHVAGHFQKVAADVARRHGGRIVKTIGDAVMWVFATPTEAFAATLELSTAFQRAVRADNLPELPVNSGVHHGSVVEAPGGDVYGATVNLAARLQGAAKDGTVVASMDAVQEVTGGFKLEPLGKLELKNVPVPVACFKVALA